MKLKFTSLVVGIAFVLADLVVSYFLSFGPYVIWMLVRNIAWPILFIFIYRKYNMYLIPLISFAGLLVGVVVASLVSIGAEGVANFTAAVFGYLLYSASFVSLLIVAVFLVLEIIKNSFHEEA